MQHIKNFLKKRVVENGLAKNITISLIIEKFEQIIKEEFGENIAHKMKPQHIKDRKLHIICLNSVIVQEFMFKKNKIISKINKSFNSEVITDIKFTIF